MTAPLAGHPPDHPLFVIQKTGEFRGVSPSSSKTRLRHDRVVGREPYSRSEGAALLGGRGARTSNASTTLRNDSAAKQVSEGT